MQGVSAGDTMLKATSKALIHAVSSLAQSQDKGSQRSFRLLKVLSVLPYCETLETIHHYLPTEPFFPQNAIQLNELAVLDVIPLQQTSPSAEFPRRGSNEPTGPKLLRVPRQVRDYVLTLISEQEREEIVFAGLERLFGRKWREGKVKLRDLPLEHREYLNSGVGNEYALIHHLLTLASSIWQSLCVRWRATPISRSNMTNILVQLIVTVILLLVSGDLLQLLDRNENPTRMESTSTSQALIWSRTENDQ